MGLGFLTTKDGVGVFMSEQLATQIIDPLGEGLVGYVKNLLMKKLKIGGTQPTAKYKGADVYFLSDTQNGYAILVKDNEILYFVRHENVKHNKFSLGRQVLVWSSGGTSYSSTGFAAHMFFDYLLPKYKTLIAKQQTAAGQRFWRYAIERALTEGKFVYFLNRRTTPSELIPLLNDDDVNKHSGAMWGTDAGHLRTFAVISEVPLTIIKT